MRVPNITPHKQEMATSSTRYGQPLVSVVIVNWNRKDDLKECLESVKAQTYKNIELIVVDNHSIDGTKELIREYFPDVKLIVMPDSFYGACETFNIGFANATGKYTVVMDNDAMLERTWIDKNVKEFEIDTVLGCIAGRVLNFYTNEDWGFWVYGLTDDWVKNEFYTTVFVGCSAMIRTDILEEVGGYPKEYFLYHNEFALGAKIINAGYKMKYNPNTKAYHKVSQTQGHSKKGDYYSIRNWYWFVWKFYPLDLVVKHTLIHFAKTVHIGLRYPSTFLKAHLVAMSKLPGILGNRTPLKERELLKPVRW